MTPGWAASARHHEHVCTLRQSPGHAPTPGQRASRAGTTYAQRRPSGGDYACSSDVATKRG